MIKKYRATLAVVALLCFSSQLVRAYADEGDDALARGLKLFDSGELKAAETVFERATKLLPSGKRRAQAHLHLGLARAYQEKFAAAKREFVRALTEDPAVKVDPERVPPAVRNAFDEARQSVTGTIILEGGPPGARAEIDGKDHGPLPHTATLRVGEHKIRVVAADGKEISTEQALVRAGERRVVRIVSQTVAVAVPTPTAPPKPTFVIVEKRGDPAEPPVEQPDAKTVAEPLAGLPPLQPEALAAAESKSGAEDDGSGDDSWFTKRRIAGLLTLAAGTATAFLGMGFGLSARGAQDEFENARQTGPFERVLAAQNAANDRSKYANILLSVGGGLVAAGLVITLWPASKERPSAKLAPTPGGVTLALEF